MHSVLILAITLISKLKYACQLVNLAENKCMILEGYAFPRPIFSSFRRAVETTVELRPQRLVKIGARACHARRRYAHVATTFHLARYYRLIFRGRTTLNPLQPKIDAQKTADWQA